jgi:adenylate cyclase
MTASRPAWISRFKPAHINKALLAAAVTAACALFAVLVVQNLPFLTSANQYMIDWGMVQFAQSEPQDPDIVIVAVDEDTLKQFRYRAPVDRQFLADLLTALAKKQPRAIGIDFLFDQPTEPSKDEALKHAIAALKMPVRIAYAESENENIVSADQLAYLKSFVPPHQRALVNLAEDQFDVVRWVYPGAKTSDGLYVLGFSRAIADALGVRTTPQQIPIAWRGRPNGPEKTFKQFPAFAVPFLKDEWFRDKIVLIGSDITLVDRHRTPFTTVYSGGEGMLPGVVIQAHALSQLLHGRSSPLTSWSADLAIAFILAGLGALLGLASQPIYLRLIGGLVLVIAFWAGDAALFHIGGPLAGPVAPSLSFALAFFAMEAASGNEARAQRKFIESVFSYHVAPEVVGQILNDPVRMTSLEGERRTMTFLFTDVADFTTMSEAMEAKELARVLNAYLEVMTEIVQKHGGMVDKFIGDAVVAIFNAPIDLPDHAEAAVRCALEMDQFSNSYSAEQRARGVPFGLTRIGVHTGAAMVGNFGSRTRHNYTASGDTVNTAARLEGLNKHFGTTMCVSGATWELCKDISFRPLASVVLKGKSKAIDVWVPLREEGVLEGFMSRYRSAYASLQAGAGYAGPQFEALAQECPGDPCVRFHLGRIRKGIYDVNVVMAEK